MLNKEIDTEQSLSQEDVKLVESYILQNVEEDQERREPAVTSFPLLETIHSMRLQNGLRRHDYSRYHRHCCRLSRRLRRQLSLTCGKGRYVRQAFPTDLCHPRYIYLLLLCVERCWSYALFLKSLLDSTSARPFKRARLRHYMHRRFRKASIYAKRLLGVVEMYGDKRTLLEAKAYVSYHDGVYLLELRHWKDSAKKLLMSQQCTLQIQHLTVVSGSYYEAVNSHVESVNALLSTATHHLKRQGILLEGLLQDKMEKNLESKVTQRQVDILWRGVGFSVTQSLLSFSQCDEIQRFLHQELDPFLDQLLTCNSLSEAQTFTSLLEKYALFEEILDKSSSCIREYLLDTSSNQNQHMSFVLESLVRDWIKIGAIELHCYLLYVILMAYSSQQAAYCIEVFKGRDVKNFSPSLISVLTQVILQILASFQKEICKSWFPAPLEAKLHETEPILLSRFSLWTRVVRDIRAFAICLSCEKNLQQKQEAYVLLKRITERRQEFMVDENDLKFPDQPIWFNTPFSRISRAILLLDNLLNPCLHTVDLLLSADLVVEGQFSNLDSSSLKDSLHQLNLSLPPLLTIPSLKPIPMKPIFLDLVSSCIEEPYSKQVTSYLKSIDQTSKGLVGRLAFWRNS